MSNTRKLNFDTDQLALSNFKQFGDKLDSTWGIFHVIVLSLYLSSAIIKMPWVCRLLYLVCV